MINRKDLEKQYFWIPILNIWLKQTNRSKPRPFLKANLNRLHYHTDK